MMGLFLRQATVQHAEESKYSVRYRRIRVRLLQGGFRALQLVDVAVHRAFS